MPELLLAHVAVVSDDVVVGSEQEAARSSRFGAYGLDVQLITRRKIQRCQLIECCPRELRVLKTDRLAFDFDGCELDHELRARIPYRELDRCNGSHADAEFFGQLATCGRQVRFACLDLATREFPQPAMSLASRATADQPALFTPDNSR